MARPLIGLHMVVFLVDDTRAVVGSSYNILGAYLVVAYCKIRWEDLRLLQPLELFNTCQWGDCLHNFDMLL